MKIITLTLLVLQIFLVECKEEQEPHPEKREANISTALIITLILLFIDKYLTNKFYEWKKKYPFLSCIQSSLLTVTIGIIAGLCLNFIKDKALGSTIKQIFQPIFMIILLPPILYSSVLSMNKKFFFKNIGCILLYALPGTMLAIICNWILLWLFQATGLFIGLTIKECFIFSVLISATDPVSVLAIFKGKNADQNLYSLIFGESILNDAVALALYHCI